MRKFLLFPALLTVCTACTILPASSVQHLRMDAGEMLYAHNRVRAALGLPSLSWSPPLARYAQEWADYLAVHNRCRMQHRSHAGMDREQYGENLYWASPLRWSDGRVEPQQITATQVSDDWASEAPFYNYGRNSCRRGEQCGHYTQMVWRSTTQVGCAASLCGDLAQLWVCNYNPPGNWIGERPY